MSLGSDYEDAVRSGDSNLANYLAQMLAANAGINIAANSVTAAPASMLHTATAPAGGDGGGFWGGLSGMADNFKGALGDIPLIPGTPLTGNQISGVVDSVSGAASGVGSAIKFITDIPRVATTLLGIILVIAGVFALTRGPAVNIVTSAVRGAVTS